MSGRYLALLSILACAVLAFAVAMAVMTPSPSNDGDVGQGQDVPAPEEENAPQDDAEATQPPQPAAASTGPQSRDVMARWSEDGETFGDEEVFVERAGVPSVIVDAEGRLLAYFQWFPEDAPPEEYDKIAVRTSEDGGASWSDPELVVVDGLPSSYKRPFDPTPVRTPDGRVRLYFTSIASGHDLDDAAIYSAIGDDGVRFTFEDGARLDVDGVPNFDSAALVLGDVWHLMAPVTTERPGQSYHATSDDGRTFGTATAIGGSDERNWTGNLIAWDDGMRFYGSSRNDGVWWAYSEDGKQWSDPTYLGWSGGDPAMVRVDDRYLMLYVGEVVR